MKRPPHIKFLVQDAQAQAENEGVLFLGGQPIGHIKTPLRDMIPRQPAPPLSAPHLGSGTYTARVSRMSFSAKVLKALQEQTNKN